MGFVLLIYLLLFIGVGWLLLSPLWRSRPFWFYGGLVIWTLLPQFYWGAMTFKDYLVFEEGCNQLPGLAQASFVKRGSIVVRGEYIDVSELKYLDRLFTSVYSETSHTRKHTVIDVARSDCPNIERDGHFQKWYEGVGCVARTSIPDARADYELTVTTTFGLFEDSRTNYTLAAEWLHELRNRASGRSISELREWRLAKRVPWSFLLFPRRIATCSTSGLDVESWLTSVMEEDA